jgi:hypothetical protein
LIYHLPHEALAALLAPIGGVDALIVDAPYSARTHGGHDAVEGIEGIRAIAYQAWTPDDVGRFVEVWHPLTAGWIVSLTDHVLAPAWAAALEAAGHVGNRDIAGFLLSKGARMNVFCAAMLGRLDIVKSVLKAFPDLKTSGGPHGLKLIHHATKGGDGAKKVLAYLQKIGAE